jgi:hypothetical protein
MIMRIGTAIALLASLAWFATCVGTPLPEPPVIQPDRILGRQGGQGSTIIEGTAGAVSEPFSTVSLVSLAGNGPTTEVLADEQGAFKALVFGERGGLLRLQAAKNGRQSAPVDVGWAAIEQGPACLVWDSWALCPFSIDQQGCENLSPHCEWTGGGCEGQAPHPLPDCSTVLDEASCWAAADCTWDSVVPDQASELDRPLDGCLRLQPEPELDISAGGTGTVHLENDCPHDVELGVSLRDGTVGFSLVSATETITLLPGETSSISVTYNPGDGHFIDDILLIAVTAPETGLLPVSLHGRRR